LGDFEYRPDLLGTDVTGGVSHWVDCGNTSMNKVAKAVRRFPRARFALFQENPQKARRLRQDVEAEVRESADVDVLGWPAGEFPRWCALLGEKVEIFGEASGVQMNLVVNEQVFATDFQRF
jgi:uncharacterized protein YaeQ